MLAVPIAEPDSFVAKTEWNKPPQGFSALTFFDPWDVGRVHKILFTGFIGFPLNEFLQWNLFPEKLFNGKAS